MSGVKLDRIQLLERAKGHINYLAQGMDPLSDPPEVSAEPVLNQPAMRKCFQYTARFLQQELEGEAHPLEERAVMKRARDCMYRLSIGRDPFTRAALPDGSVLRQEKLAACFRYAFLVLQRVVKPPQDPADPMTPEMRERVAYSQGPIPFKQFVAHLNDLLGYTDTFLYVSARGWLIQEGLLEEQQENEKLATVPTRRGREVGLSARTVEREDPPPFPEVLCDETAQRLIVDNLVAALARSAHRYDELMESLTPELCICMRGKPEAVSLTKVLEQISRLLPEGVKMLSALQVNTYLVRRKLMGIQGSHRIPTQAGEAIGITCSSYNGRKNGSVLWTEVAQRYLVDHLWEIVLDLRSGEAYRAVEGSSV